MSLNRSFEDGNVFSDVFCLKSISFSSFVDNCFPFAVYNLVERRFFIFQMTNRSTYRILFDCSVSFKSDNDCMISDLINF